LILVFIIIVMPVSIWLLKGFMDSLPYDIKYIKEAAIMDGCSPCVCLARSSCP